MTSKTRDGNRRRPTALDVRRVLTEAFRAQEGGRLADASDLCRQILRQNPKNAEALHLLGLVSQQTGKYAEAARLTGRAARLAPGNPQYQYNYGESCRMAGRFRDAEAAFRRALALAPAVADIHFNLGNALLEQDRAQQALTSFERAIQLDPEDADFQLARGLALEGCVRTVDAVAAYGRAIDLRPDFAAALLNRGAALQDLGQLEPAIADLRRTLAIEPRSVQALLKLGACLQDLGEFREAAACFEQVLAIDPNNARAHYNLVVNHSRSPNPSDVRALERLLASRDTDVDDRIDLSFAAAKISEDLGLYDKAFVFYRSANELAARQKRWDRRAFKAGVDAGIEVFDKTLFEDNRDAGNPSELPVFIVGMPRSGTTLVEQILASHESVYGGGELNEISRLATETLPKDTGIAYPAAIRALSRSSLTNLARKHLEVLRELAPNAARVTDKMPDNFRYLGLIALMFPRARIIHCRRDPMDTCISCYTQHFATGQDFSHRLGDLGAYYRDYARLMDHWRHVLPVQLLEIDYETLVTEQKGETSRILDYCGLDWDDACLKFFETKRRVATASFEQVRRPIYTSSVGRWRRFDRHLAPLKEALGVNITAQPS